MPGIHLVPFLGKQTGGVKLSPEVRVNILDPRLNKSTLTNPRRKDLGRKIYEQMTEGTSFLKNDNNMMQQTNKREAMSSKANKAIDNLLYQ